MKNFKFICLAMMGVSLIGCDDDENFDGGNVLPADDQPAAMVMSNGFYVANEGWFGHDAGSVNYFKKNGDAYDISYRLYATANGGETLGKTTSFASIWGDNFYFVSKQDNRLVVADAKTMKKKAVITDLNGADGRSFLGIDEKKAYIGLSDGIVTFDLENFNIGKNVEGIAVRSEIGNMVYSNGKVFAISKEKVYVINPQTNKVEKEFGGSFKQMITDRNGRVIAGDKDGFMIIDPITLESSTIAYPDGVSLPASWGSWNPGGLCASLKHNVIYWTSGKGWSMNSIYKTDLDSKTSTLLYTFGKSENEVDLEFYGAGLRVDPLTDELIATVIQSGWGENSQYNWIYKFDAEGKELTNFEVLNSDGKKYYWFPSVPVFEDANKPQILLNAVSVSQDEKVEIDLAEKIVDYDNTFASIVKKVDASAISDKAAVSVVDNKLVVESKGSAGNCKFKLIAVSNGVKVEKDIELVILSK